MQKGTHHTEEAKRKISETRKSQNRKTSDETKAKISAARRAKEQSKEEKTK